MEVIVTIVIVSWLIFFQMVSNMFYFHPELWGRFFSHFDEPIFSDGLQLNHLSGLCLRLPGASCLCQWSFVLQGAPWTVTAPMAHPWKVVVQLEIPTCRNRRKPCFYSQGSCT